MAVTDLDTAFQQPGDVFLRTPLQRGGSRSNLGARPAAQRNPLLDNPLLTPEVAAARNTLSPDVSRFFDASVSILGENFDRLQAGREEALASLEEGLGLTRGALDRFLNDPARAQLIEDLQANASGANPLIGDREAFARRLEATNVADRAKEQFQASLRSRGLGNSGFAAQAPGAFAARGARLRLDAQSNIDRENRQFREAALSELGRQTAANAAIEAQLAGQVASGLSGLAAFQSDVPQISFDPSAFQAQDFAQGIQERELERQDAELARQLGQEKTNQALQFGIAVATQLPGVFAGSGVSLLVLGAALLGFIGENEGVQ